MSTKYNLNIITDGLVLCLDAANKKSYSGSGTTWTDRSGNGNNGTLVNGPTFDSGNGGSIYFDGVDDDCNIESSAVSIVQGQTNFTIGVWVKMVATGSLKGLIGTLNYACGTNLGLTASGSSLQFFNDTATCVATSIDSWVETGKWLYCVGTYDGVTTKVYGYKDGVLSTNSMTTKSGAANTFSTTFRVFGDHHPIRTNCYGAVAFAYNRTLSDAEIHQNYNTLKSRFGL